MGSPKTAGVVQPGEEGRGRFGLLFSCVYFFLLEGKFCVRVAGKTRGAAHSEVKGEMPKVRGVRAWIQAVGWARQGAGS